MNNLEQFDLFLDDLKNINYPKIANKDYDRLILFSANYIRNLINRLQEEVKKING